jgi:hypothetical protein
MSMKFVTVLVAVVCTASGCATTPGDAGDGPSGARECVSQSRISSFEALDPSRMLIYGPGQKEAYLAELGAGCAGMDRRSTISFVDGDRNGSICGLGNDSVAFKDGPRIANCSIRSMIKLTPAAREQIEVEYGLKKAPKATSSADSK